MKNETEKLNKFKLAVFSQVEQQAQEIIQEAQSQQKQRLAEAKQESQSELSEQLSAIDKQCRAKTLREISSRKLDAQRSVLTHRNEMIEKVFDNIRKSLAEFCKSENYRSELKQRLDKCAAQSQGKGTAYFAKRDIELGRELCKGTRFTAQQSDSITLGGVTVIFADSNLAYDCTFDSTFERERQNFSKAAGLAQI